MYAKPWIGPTIATTDRLPASCNGMPTRVRISRRTPTTYAMTR